MLGIDIYAMSQFAVSDTVASDCKVSRLFEDFVPINNDCTMHVLNQCLQYALGVRENKRL